MIRLALTSTVKPYSVVHLYLTSSFSFTKSPFQYTNINIGSESLVVKETPEDIESQIQEQLNSSLDRKDI